ncbi:hypothetical protein ACIQXD_29800 [Streptomyces uncialis]|uniref:hypothetical protein n=1 Tax=Streptomyces uncialis TaxID=1048205 RepID=UPI0038069F46
MPSTGRTRSSRASERDRGTSRLTLWICTIAALWLGCGAWLHMIDATWVATLYAVCHSLTLSAALLELGRLPAATAAPKPRVGALTPALLDRSQIDLAEYHHHQHPGDDALLHLIVRARNGVLLDSEADLLHNGVQKLAAHARRCNGETTCENQAPAPPDPPSHPGDSVLPDRDRLTLSDRRRGGATEDRGLARQRCSHPRLPH